MSDSRGLRTTFPLLLILLLSCPLLLQAGVGFRLSLRDSTVSNQFIVRQVRGISSFEPRPIIELAQPQAIYDAVIDSTYDHVTFTYHVKNTDLAPPAVLTYDHYRDERYTADVEKEWHDEIIRTYKRTEQQHGGEGIAIDVPFRIKSKTFRRLFGGENVGVRVQGNITINGNVRRQSSDQFQTANLQNANTSFRIDMVQQFSITGKVGQKVEVRVDQDSERLFDFENSLKLTYTGDEDEIVQKVEAGNVNLNLGTRLATFSGKNTGLFGLKSQLKFGPLNVTGIASLERGQKNRQRPNQQQQQQTFNERNFLRDVYFWLTGVDQAVIDGDLVTVPNFRNNYRIYQNRSHVTVAQPDQIQNIEVWVSRLGQPGQGETQYTGRAVAIQKLPNLFLDQQAWSDSVTNDNRNNVQTTWEQLDRGTEYTIDTQLGFIRLKQPLQDQQALGVAFVTNGGQLLGRIQQPADSLRLILLRPPSPSPTDSTWNLMFRNVYYVGATGIIPDKFRLTINRESASSQQDEVNPPVNGFCPQEYGASTGCTYLTFFRLDVEGQAGAQSPDGMVDQAVLNAPLGELHFLDLTPFDPSGYIDRAVGPEPIVWPLRELDQAVDSTAEQFVAPYLYNTLPTQFNQHGPALWRMTTEFTGTSSVFQLGPLVLQGSEEVTLNGAPLERGRDYTIDYSSGELRILNEAAKAAGANLEITYESGTVFQLDKKTLLGARAEYELWDQSYVGAMVLHLNEKTLDKRVRIGSEPVRNTLYDVNTSLRFTPNFLSQAVDHLPLIQTQQGSELVLDGEVARVYPNPNSLENPATGDYNGLAYIDDFEQSRRATPLGLLRRMWTISSIPLDDSIDPRRGRLRWWSPRSDQQVDVQEVFPEREVNSQVAQKLPTLVVKFDPDTGMVGNTGPPERSWGGVMRYLGEGYADQSQSQYLELWVQLPSQPEGKLVFDLGEISEDALPNGRMDTEDLPVGVINPQPDQEYGNGLLDGNEDTGLDGIAGQDPTDVAYWNGLDYPPIPSMDDWSFDPNDRDPQQVNGTERNRNDEGGNYPDTEDLNNDNFLNTTNNYFSYTVDLDYDSPYIVGGQDNINHWRLFRIPIQTTDPSVRREVGSPDLTNVRWARFYVTGVTREITLKIVQMDIVSNEWIPPAQLNVDSTSWVEAAVINTHENPGYVSPPGVQGEVDPITQLRQREQSLVLKVNRLDHIDGTPAPEEFFLAKNLYQPMNLLEYKRLKMFVHGGGEDPAVFPDGKYQLILRLASSDILNNYYDIISTVKSGWDPQNVIDVALNEVSLLGAMRDSVLSGPDSVNYPDLTAAGRFAVDRTDTPWPEDSLVIKGNPSFSRVYYIALGVRLLPKHYIGEGDEIWVDELRVSDIYKDPGTAAELNASLKLADFINLQGGYSTRDADFHNVNVRTSAGQGGSQSSNTTMRGNATIALHKIGLDRYGFQLPLTVNYTDNLSVPKYIPNTDSRIDPKNAPEDVKSVQQTYGYTLRYSKTGNSSNPFVRWSLEKLTLGWDYNLDKRHDFNTINARSETSSATAGYSFPTAKGRGVAPLAWTRQIPGLNLLGSPRIYFKPTRLQFTGRADRRDEYRLSRQGNIATTSPPIINSSGGANVSFNFFDPLTTDFSRTYQAIKQNGDWSDILSGDFGRTNQMQQNFTNTYSPRLASWLRPTMNYTSGYTWANRNLQQRGQQSVQNQRNVGTDLTLDFRAIFGSSGGGGRGKERGRERGREHTPQRPGGGDIPQHPPRPEGMPMPGDTSHARPMPGGEAMPGSPGAPGEQGNDSLHVPSDTTHATPETPQEERHGFTLGQQLAKVISPLKKGLMALDPIALGYDNTQSHSQGATSGQASLAYQLGFTQDPGTAVDSGYQSFPMKRKDQNLTARSGLRFTQNIRTSFNYGRRWGESIQSNIPGGSTEETMFWLGGKGKPTRFPFVDVTADWSGLEKFSFLKRVAQTVSLTSGVSQKVSETWSNQRSNITRRDYTRQWNPLLGVTFTWRGNIDSQIRYGRTNRMSENVTGRTKSRSTENRISATFSYTIRTGFRLPILWMSSLRLQNQTTFSLNVDYSKSKDEATQASSGVYVPRSGEQAWSLQPRMTYSFSNTVQGQGYVQVQQTKNNVTNIKNRVFEFGIQVNIAIRG